MLQGRSCRNIKALAGKIVSETRPGRFQGPCLRRPRHSFHLNMLSTHTDAVLDLDSLVCVSYSDRVSSCSPCQKKKTKKSRSRSPSLHVFSARITGLPHHIQRQFFLQVSTQETLHSSQMHPSVHLGICLSIPMSQRASSDFTAASREQTMAFRVWSSNFTLNSLCGILKWPLCFINDPLSTCFFCYGLKTRVLILPSFSHFLYHSVSRIHHHLFWILAALKVLSCLSQKCILILGNVDL